MRSKNLTCWESEKHGQHQRTSIHARPFERFESLIVIERNHRHGNANCVCDE